MAKTGEPPLKPVALLPAIETNTLTKHFEQLPISFDLPALDGAVAWQSQVASDSAFNQIVAEAESDSQQLTFADVPDGDYYLVVRAKDKQGISGFDAKHPFVVAARPFAPKLNKGVATFRTPNPQLQWPSVEQANAYLFEVATDDDFKQVIIHQQINQSIVQVDKPLTEGDYYWRVASLSEKSDGGFKQGPFSQVAQFAYVPPPPVPNIDGLQVNVERNHVYVNAPKPESAYQYHVVLDNPYNQQQSVWQGTKLSENFDFSLREFGKQTLRISYIDSDGIIGPAAIYEFDASPK